MSKHITISSDNTIVRIDFARPEKKNALTQAMYTALADAIRQADSDPGVRVILLAGGDQDFTAGNDLHDFMQASQQTASNPAMDFLFALSTARKPVVAAVKGVAIGIGVTLLLHCDLVYAGHGARLQLPFVNLGLTPEAASSLILPQLIGHRRAAELLLLGDRFDASTAHQYGIVNAVVPDDEVLTVAYAAAQRLAEKAPTAVQLSKHLLKQHTAEQVQTVMSMEFQHFVERLSSPEAAEAFAAFTEKRKADFSNLQ